MENNWNLINARQKEGNQDLFDLSKYEIKKPKKLNPTYELRKELASIVRRPLLQVMGLTKGWSERDLKGCITDSLAFKTNTPAYAWKIIRELNNKKKLCKLKEKKVGK